MTPSQRLRELADALDHAGIRVDGEIAGYGLDRGGHPLIVTETGSRYLRIADLLIVVRQHPHAVEATSYTLDGTVTGRHVEPVGSLN